jgi:signal transduction histidine kinase
MPRFSFASLRSRAIILVLLAILPLLALTFYSYMGQRNRAVAEVQRDELVAVRNVATLQETLIRNSRQILETLAQLPVVQRRDRDGCNLLFARLLEQSPHYSAIVAADPEGQVFASAPATKGPVNVADRLGFKKALQTRAFFVGEPVLGRVSGKYTLILSYPIIDDTRRVRGAIVAGLNLNWLGGLLDKSELPPSTALVLADAAGKVLFRYPEPLKYLGKKMPDFLIKDMTSRSEGVEEGIGLPGDKRLFGFVRLAPPWQNMRVVIGLPKDSALGRVNQDLRRNLIWLGLVALLAMTAAWFGSEFFIVRQVRRLRLLIEHVAAGDLTVRCGPEYAVGELGHLAHTFNQMADALQERAAELNKATAELHARVRDLDQRTIQLEAANKELEAFAYSVSHDLRAPLRSIGGFARVLLEDYPDKLDDDGKRYLNIIHQDARKMGQLIDDLLALSRLGRKEMSLVPIDMAKQATEIFKELKDLEPGRNLHLEIQSLPLALGDRAMIRQVMVNLLSNAIKFNKGHGPALIRVSGWTNENDNVYCVKDNGVGFDMRYADKLFGVFQRLHNDEEFEGTGVGLAIVKRIVERHGGRLWAEGKVGEGATFCFALPNKG